MNLSNYFFRTDSIVLISITCSLLALGFMHEIRETSDVRLMPEIMQIPRLIPLNTINIVSYNKFSKPRPGPVFRPKPSTVSEFCRTTYVHSAAYVVCTSVAMCLNCTTNLEAMCNEISSTD